MAALQDGCRPPFADMLRRTAAMVRQYAAAGQPETDHEQLTRTLEDLLGLQRQVGEQRHTRPESWLAEGDLVIELDRLLRELADTSHTIRQTGRPPR